MRTTLLIPPLLASCAALRALAPGDGAHGVLRGSLARPAPGDYVAHLVHLGGVLAGPGGWEFARLSPADRRYLRSLVRRLVEGNRSLYGDGPAGVSFHVVKSRVPFAFTLPGGRYFYSTGVFRKYIRSEGLLAAVVALQTFRTFHGVYVRRTVVPTGHVGLGEMLALVRIPLEYRDQVNKWGHATLGRAGFDPTPVLDWIQVRNRNVLDFALMDGEPGVVSREEFAFKNFLVSSDRERGGSPPPPVPRRNSSRAFYGLVRRLASQGG